MPAETDSLPPLPDPVRPNWTWLTFQFILQIVFAVWLRYRARGLRNIPAEGGGLVLMNHQSFLDPLLVQLPLSRPVGFLARENLFRVPFVGWVLRRHYCVGINRESAGTRSIRETVRRMRFGFLMGVFPEGTRTRDGSVGDFKPGFVALVRRNRLPIVPVGIAGAYEALPRGARFLRPRKVCVVYGDPIPYEELEPFCRRGREDELVALARDRVVACQREADEWRIGGKCGMSKLQCRTSIGQGEW